MPRIAGNKGHYTLGLIDAQGAPTGHIFPFPSVTTIIDAVVATKKLHHWYYTQTVKGVVELLGKYGSNLPTDEASLRSLLTTEGLSPYGVRNKGGERGTSIHDDLEKLVAGKKPRKTKTNAPLLAWWEEKGLKPADIIATEAPLFSFKQGYAGTLDLVYKDPNDGATVLADLKSSKYIVWTHFLQLRAYEMAWLEMGGQPIDRSTIIQASPALERWSEHMLTDEVPADLFQKVLDIYKSLPYEWTELEGGDV